MTSTSLLQNNDFEIDPKNLPTQESIQKVENFLSEVKEYPMKPQLSKDLPESFRHPSIRAILKYLEKSNKIIYDKDDTLVWVFSDVPEHEQLQHSF